MARRLIDRVVDHLALLKERFSFDTQAVREDIRKIAVAMMIASFIGGIVVTDKVSTRDSFFLGVVGVIFWVLSLVKKRDEEER